MRSSAARIAGIVSIIAGILFIVAGGVTWGIVSSQLAAENIALGFRVTDVVTGWMNSEGHRFNILDGHTALGVGFAYDSDGQPWYVQNFAAYPPEPEPEPAVETVP